MKGWWLKLLHYALAEWRGLIFIGLATLAGISVKLVAPWPLKLIVDYALVKKSLPEGLSWIQILPGSSTAHGLLAWLAATTVLLFLAKRLLKIVKAYVQAGTSSRMKYNLATDVFHQLQNRSLIFHGKRRVGDLMKRVSGDCDCVTELVMSVYLPVVTSLVTLVSMFLVMWQLNSTLALFAVGLALPLGLVTRHFARPLSELSYEGQELQGELMSHAEQTLTAMPVVQAYQREQAEVQRFRSLAKQIIQMTLRTGLCQEKFTISTNGLTSLATAVVMVVGGLSVLDGSMTIGTLLVLMSYFAALYSPIESFAYMGTGFATARSGARRVLGILESEEDYVQEAPNAQPLPRLRRGQRGHICLEGVTFGYEPDHPVLRDVSLEARPGEVVALVGRTGAGKSTLASLITRLHDPWTGTIRFDGVDLRELQLESLRDSVSIVLQEPFLFRMSIAENIAYGRPDASRDEIVAAAQAASADGFIQRLPRGYDTIIGERGITLSGGEKQRLSLARALLKDAPVLILDEPTSALDAQTEFTLLNAMERLMQGRTTFVIAHRLSTIRKADRIVVLDEGRVVESGSHDELLSIRGKYAQLQQWQFGARSEGGKPASPVSTEEVNI